MWPKGGHTVQRQTTHLELSAMKSGFEAARFVTQLLKRHECPICLLAMRDPVQTECGHLFCRGCLETALTGDRRVCPVDNNEISKDNFFADTACKREILSLEVYCDHADNGCSWIGPLKELETHTENCIHRRTVCRLCGLQVPITTLASHQERECPMRTAPCCHCKKDVPLLQMEAHIERVCSEFNHQCPNRCDLTPKLKLLQLEAHLHPKTGDCPLVEVPCPFQLYGCTFMSQRQNLSTHLDESRVHHIHLQTDCWKELKEKVDKNTTTLDQVNNHVAAMEARFSYVTELQDTLKQRIDAAVNTRVGPGSDKASYDMISELMAQVIQIKEQMDGCSGYRRIDNKEHNGKTTNYTCTCEPAMGICSEDFSTSTLNNLQARTVELDHGLDRCLSSCLDQELRLQLLERATYNGVLLWKIDDFARRRKEAVDGVTMSLYSIPFYTSRHGYKMCTRVYLNGDGMGKGTHLSFFFVVMKGPFDALLPWPFKQKVSLTIINQAGKSHVTDTFCPDPQSNSFQRPSQKEMNIASGCPMFIHHDQLFNGGFVKDDCIFLRVTVDTVDLPQNIPC